jgi:hypothetical protein
MKTVDDSEPTPLQLATAKARASADALGNTVDEWNRKFGAAPVMDTCAEVRSSSPTSGGGFVERELAVARGLAACRGDEADAEIAELRGQAVVLRRLLADALAVLRTIEPDDTDEAERLERLCAAVALTLQPKREGTLL